MKKLVKTGDSRVVQFIKETFSEPDQGSYSSSGYFSCYCGFVCPMFSEFEVFEEIELPEDRSLPIGIYKVVYHDGGNTSHYIHIEKWNPENLTWERHTFTHAGWEGSVMINWLGIKRVSVQGNLF